VSLTLHFNFNVPQGGVEADACSALRVTTRVSVESIGTVRFSDAAFAAISGGCASRLNRSLRSKGAVIEHRGADEVQHQMPHLHADVQVGSRR
jgi:hypothetical protein